MDVLLRNSQPRGSGQIMSPPPSPDEVQVCTPTQATGASVILETPDAKLQRCRGIYTVIWDVLPIGPRWLRQPNV